MATLMQLNHSQIDPQSAQDSRDKCLVEHAARSAPRNIILVASVFGLLLVSDVTTDMSWLTRAGVVSVVQMLGMKAHDLGDALQIGRITLSWTDACSGVNTWIVLLGIAAWVYFSDSTIRLTFMLVATLPAALVSNVLRVLLVAAYRMLLYPAWEGEQLHYLFSFLSVLPFVFWLAKPSLDARSFRWSELIYLVSILAVISTEFGAPGGAIVFLSAVGCLAPIARRRQFLRSRPAGWSVVWVLAAVGIAAIGAESLWLPWLLVCPHFVDSRVFSSPLGWLMLLGTLPIVAVQTAFQWILALTAGWRLLARDHAEPTHDGIPQGGDPVALAPAAARPALFALAFPFLLPGFLSGFQVAIRPPQEVMQRDLGNAGYQIRLMGQPRDLAAFWYGSSQQGRHHSVRNCLRFRGVATESVTDSLNVIQSESMWIREYFIVDRQLIPSYAEYVRRCFPPLTSHGVHLVFQSPRSATDPKFFAEETDRLAVQLLQAHQHRIRVAQDDADAAKGS